jgi:hypothetical protein
MPRPGWARSDARDADADSLERRVNHLATERTRLFSKAGSHRGLSKSEQERLKAIERELDHCFILRRQQRAARDARRFSDEISLRHLPRRGT